MLTTQNIRAIYEKIQKQLFYMIPENWDKVYLYASVIDRFNGLQTGEMFFYYYPKSVLKKNPVNVYEIPSKFNIDEKQYMNLAEKLYNEIKRLKEEHAKAEDKIWSNITISIEDCQFKVEYRYDDLISTKYNSYDRHIVWRYQYLKLPLELFSKSERNMIQEFLVDYKNVKTTTYTEGIYKRKVSKNIEYNIERSINKDTYNKINGKFNKKSSKKLDVADTHNTIKSQILMDLKQPKT